MSAAAVKRLTIALLAIAFLGVPGLRGMAAAQTPVTRIVYDQCRAAGTWYATCSIGMAVDGSDTLIANGVGPKWSPDGAKIAFTFATIPQWRQRTTFVDQSSRGSGDHVGWSERSTARPICAACARAVGAL